MIDPQGIASAARTLARQFVWDLPNFHGPIRFCRVNLEWVPWGERESKSTLIKVSNTAVVRSLQAGTFTKGFFDLLIFADKVDPSTNTLKHVFIFDEREENNPVAIVAESGQIMTVLSDSDLGGAAVLKLRNGNIHQNDINEDTYQKIDFDTYRLFLEVKEGEDTKAIKPKMLSYKKLRYYMNTAEPDSWQEREMKTEYWRRITVALSPFVFVLLGIGFGAVRTRSVQSSAVLVAIGIFITYWGLQVIGTTLSHKGILYAPLAMMIPNIVLAIVGAYFFRKAAW